jgi:hypothetical protein
MVARVGDLAAKVVDERHGRKFGQGVSVFQNEGVA